MPDVGHRDAEVLGEGAGPVDADALRVLAEMAAAGQAVAAAAADDVPLAGDDVADLEVVDVAADRDDPADELVADHHRHGDGLLRPGVPVVDVDVGAADGRLVDLDQHVVDADFGHGISSSHRPGCGMLLDEGFHGLLHKSLTISFEWAVTRDVNTTLFTTETQRTRSPKKFTAETQRTENLKNQRAKRNKKSICALSVSRGEIIYKPISVLCALCVSVAN